MSKTRQTAEIIGRVIAMRRYAMLPGRKAEVDRREWVEKHKDDDIALIEEVVELMVARGYVGVAPKREPEQREAGPMLEPGSAWKLVPTTPTRHMFYRFASIFQRNSYGRVGRHPMRMRPGPLDIDRFRMAWGEALSVSPVAIAHELQGPLGGAEFSPVSNSAQQKPTSASGRFGELETVGFSTRPLAALLK